MPKNIAVIVLCGGRSTRFGENKLLVPLNGKPVFIQTLLAFDEYPVVLVVPKDSFDEFSIYLKKFEIKPYKIVFGGNSRQESVFNAVRELDDFEFIAIHDGARPLIAKNDIENVVNNAEIHGAAVLCVPVKDTIKQFDGEKITTIDRKTLSSTQTPQVFNLNLYKKAMALSTDDYTDDCQLLENIGINPHITMGSYSNIKITTREDLAFAETFYVKKSHNLDFRIGQGYDVHQLAKNRDLILGGVKIPNTMGLAGHSDADVLVHAIMDSLLGAAGLGDIGKQFPDTDIKFKDISSLILLEKVCFLLKNLNFEISNIDSTIVAQSPKLSPFIPKMCENIAKITKSNVNVKATTEENLGFTGQHLGVSAQAVSLICHII